MKHLLSIIFVVLFVAAQSQNVTIKGYANAAPDKLVRLIVYADQFSHLEKTIATERTSPKGNFFMTAPIHATDYAFFALDLKKSEIYLVPGKTYTLKIAHDTAAEKGSIFDQAERPLPMEITHTDGRLNNAIGKFNTMYNTFVYQHFNQIYQERSQKIIRNFEQAVKDTFPDITSEYFKNYIRYTLASLQWLSHRKSDNRIASEYFVNQTVLYQNIAYTDFFHEFFKGYFQSQINTPVSYSTLLDLIAFRPEFSTLDKLFKKDSLLAKDSRLRELVEMKIMSQYYYDSEFSKSNIEHILKEIKMHSNYPKIKYIAANYLKKLKKLGYGTVAPTFNLPDMLGNERSLAYYKGKFVLLNFIKTGCNICNKQLESLAKIKRQFGNRFVIVSLLTGKNPGKTVAYFADNGYDWPLLLLGKKITLLEKYNVKAFPAYILVYPNGSIALAPAPGPDENLEMLIRHLINRFESKH